MDDLQELKADVKEILQRTAVHNEILAEHKNFSVALQNEQKLIKSQLEPLLKDHHLISVCLKLLGAILIGVLIQMIIRTALFTPKIEPQTKPQSAPQVRVSIPSV